MSSPLDLRIGTSATDTELPVWPRYDHEGREYIKNGIATVNLGGGKFAVVGAGRDPDPDSIKALKDRVKNGSVEEFETAPQDFSGVISSPAPTVQMPPSPPVGTFASELDTVPDDSTPKSKRGKE